MHTPTVVVRRRVLEEVGGFDGSLTVCEDYQLWLRIATLFPFHMVPEPLAFRRLHQKRLSKSAMYRNLVQRAEMLEGFRDGLGGREVLQARRAVRRLARVFRAAGQANLRARRYADAHALFRRSLDYAPRDVRTRVYLWYAGLLRNSVMDRSSEVLAAAEEFSA